MRRFEARRFAAKAPLAQPTNVVRLAGTRYEGDEAQKRAGGLHPAQCVTLQKTPACQEFSLALILLSICAMRVSRFLRFFSYSRTFFS